MKRSLLITCTALFAAATLFSSCRKSFTCSCVYYVKGVPTSVGNYTINEWRDDAQNLCNYKQARDFVSIPYPVTCDLK